MKRILCALFVLMFSSLAAADGSNMYNFRFSPIGLIVGAIGVNLDVAVTPEWTVGPDVRYWKFKWGTSSSFSYENEIVATSFGARANWFKNGNYTDGLYVGPSLKFASVKATVSDSTESATGTVSGLYAGCLVGYGWFWDSFNMMLGGGAVLGLGESSVKVTHSNGTTEEVSVSRVSGLDLEFSLGWTF